MLIYQDELHPTQMLGAITSLVDERTTGIRIASAYVTGGIRVLIPRLKALVGATWPHIPKDLITCFDYGITDPVAFEVSSWTQMAIQSGSRIVNSY